MTYTTLNQLSKHNPCQQGWAKLTRALGPRTRYDAPLPLIRILETNGLDDAIWALRASPEAMTKVGEFARRTAERAKGYAARYAANAAHYAANAAADAARYAANAAAAANAANAANAAADAAAGYAANAANAARYAARYATNAAEREAQRADYVELFS